MRFIYKGYNVYIQEDHYNMEPRFVEWDGLTGTIIYTQLSNLFKIVV